MDGRYGWGGCVVDSDSQSLQGFQGKGQGIAHDALAGRDGHLVFLVEHDILGTLRVDSEGILGMGDVDGADDNRFGAIDVAQFETNHVASDAHLDHLSDGAVRHIVVIGHKALDDGLWGGCPCANPVLCRSL